MKDLSLKQLQALKEKWYQESSVEQHEFTYACEELGKMDLTYTVMRLNVGDFTLRSTYVPNGESLLTVGKGKSVVLSTGSRLFVPGCWVEELRGLIANLRAERKEQQRQELLKQLNPFEAV